MDGRISNYEYLVVVDLELVPKFVPKSSGFEAVELSWAVLPNTLNIPGSDSVAYKEQLFIIPERACLRSEDYPGLENGVSASTALRRFDKYLRNALISKNRTFSFVVERVATFQYLRTLALEHLDSNSSPHWLRTFTLLSEFGRAYVSPEPVTGVSDMLRLLRAQHHVPFTALDCCLAQCAIITRMLRDGFSFSSPEMVAGPAQGRISAWDSITTEVWATGIGGDVEPQHLLNFFKMTSSSLQIIIPVSRVGNPTGIAILRFSSHQEAMQALNTLNHSSFGEFQICLSLALPGEFERISGRQTVIREHLAHTAALAPSWPTSSNSLPIVQAHLAPMPTSSDSAMQLSAALPSSPPSSGNWSGSVASSIAPLDNNYAHAGAQPAQEAPPVAPDNTTQISSPVMTATQSPVLLNRNVLLDMCSRFSEGTVVRVRGLLPSITQAQIAEFFASFEFIPSSIVLTTLEDSRPSGDAFLAFNSAEQAETAVNSLTGKVLGSSPVELSLVN